MEVNESIEISETPQTIWAFWLLVTEDIHWRDGISKAEWTTPPPHGIGSTGVHYHKDMGAMSWEVISFRDGRSFEFVHRAGKLKGSTAFFEVTPKNTGSHVLVQAKITGPLLMRFTIFFMRGIMRKGLQSDLQRLKELMEDDVTNV